MNIIKKIFYLVLLTSLSIVSCKDKKNVPNVDDIKVSITVQRFEQDLFNANLNNLSVSFDTLSKKYNSFFVDYLYQILRLNPQPDSTLKEAQLFITDSVYHKIYADATKKFADFNDIKEELTLAIKLTKHYFPKYKAPQKIVTFIGPIDGIGVALTSNNAIAVGLQGFMGKNYEAYNNSYIAQTYPAYKTRRFEPQYIATNCIKDIIDEMFVDKSKGQSLIERMIENGRRLYLLDALLPYTEDSVKTGYTAMQLSDCDKNEKVIWSYFVQNNLLFEKEPSIISPYVTDGPKTSELSESAPGNIGMFTGWQIVKKWMKQNDKMSLEQLMQTPAMTIFNQANYAP